jgi:NitT/TauT family transport system substrate-binding protein
VIPTLRRVAVLGTALVAAVAVGCGGGGGGGAGGSSGGKATLKVGVLPISDVAPLYLGIKKGFFEQEKLTIKPQVLQGGAEVTTAVASGKLNLGFAAAEVLIVAKSKGLPVQIVSQGNQAAASTAEAWDGVVVRANSPIKTPQDLAGKTIAVNALKGSAELSIRAVLTRDGVDVSKLKFLEVPFPDMLAALQSGRVDAAAPVEPFVSQARATGGRVLFSYFAGLQPKLTVGTYFAMTPFIDKNADLIKRFVRAMNRSLTYAQAHPDEARQVVLTYTKIPAKVARTMKLSYWSSDLNVPSIELTARDAERFGFVKSAPNVDDLIWRGAG